jgi:Caspase domain
MHRRSNADGVAARAARCLFLSCSLLVLAANAVDADTPLQRYTLIVGANFGGADRPVLKYGVSDAERFARVMVDLGGVSPEHNTILKQPKLRDLLDGLDLLTRRVADAARLAGPGGARTEVIVYYSGHADEKGLLLGEDRYSYRSLRDRLDQIPADVRIAVLDACASGAFTRIKGGRARPPFLVDQSASMRGHAFLTSSAANEVAQESDRIRASYFTHYLVSGLRGAADLSGDGRITLNEAYQFAFGETLGRTVDSKGGVQHPSYDINMSGTGDVVMTDVRQLSATLVLDQEVEGRFFVHNAARELIVEVYKPYGRTVALGVEPGAYEVRVEREKTALLAKVSVADGGRLTVDRKQFNPTTVEATRSRGPADALPYAVAGRNRLEVRLGMWSTGATNTVSSGISIGNVFGGIQYTRYLEENLAITFAIEGVGQSGQVASSQGAFSGLSSIATFPVGVRWNPLPYGRQHDGIKPFLAAGAGPAIGETLGSYAGRNGAWSGINSGATAFGYLRGGADFHFARSFAIGVDAGYNWVGDFGQPAPVNYSGFNMGLGIGWLFGRGTVARP